MASADDKSLDEVPVTQSNATDGVPGAIEISDLPDEMAAMIVESMSVEAMDAYQRVSKQARRLVRRHMLRKISAQFNPLTWVDAPFTIDLLDARLRRLVIPRTWRNREMMAKRLYFLNSECSISVVNVLRRYHETDVMWQKRQRFVTVTDNDEQRGDEHWQDHTTRTCVSYVFHPNGAKLREVHGTPEYEYHREGGLPTLIEWNDRGTKKSEVYHYQNRLHRDGGLPAETLWNDAGDVIEKQYWVDGVRVNPPA